MNRPSWDEYFMQITHLVASRATCLRRKVGAILVRDKRILTTGYNGPPAGLPHCDELGGCLRDKLGVASGERHELSRAVHAEQNAIIQAAVHGISIEGATLYATNQPCSLCTKMLVNAGIREFVIADGYPDELAKEIMEQAGVVVRKVNYPPHKEKVE
ncbi:MAG TPA: cytidine deaminase [Bacteroidetes bacterium]|nr:cytidine deaminase [Bacteroidota bacterium]